jgi:two-component system response regulator NreC
MIRVVIVDDHALVRSGLRLLLDAEEDITVEDEGGTADEAVRLARLHKPDVVLLDVVMPGRSGLDAAAEVHEAAPKAKILVLSMQDDPSYVRQAFSAGATGYLLKEAADAELVAAVREVAGGGRYVHPTLGARLAAAEAEAQARAAADPLSDREREVLRLLALGQVALRPGEVEVDAAVERVLSRGHGPARFAADPATPVAPLPVVSHGAVPERHGLAVVPPPPARRPVASADRPARRDAVKLDPGDPVADELVLPAVAPGVHRAVPGIEQLAGPGGAAVEALARGNDRELREPSAERAR